jgi:hypothetical protein
MIDPNNVTDVATNELLARYVLQKNHVRSDQSIKPNAYMPPPDLELSVTRHLSATEEELWSVGEDVAMTTGKTLYGRGDVPTTDCVDQNLSVVAAPIIPNNPNHAHIIGWPTEKSAQKNIAQEIASRTTYVQKP